MKTNARIAAWSRHHKHALRELYATFLADTTCSFEEWRAGKVASYPEFVATMFKNSKR